MFALIVLIDLMVSAVVLFVANIPFERLFCDFCYLCVEFNCLVASLRCGVMFVVFRWILVGFECLGLFVLFWFYFGLVYVISVFVVCFYEIYFENTLLVALVLMSMLCLCGGCGIFVKMCIWVFIWVLINLFCCFSIWLWLFWFWLGFELRLIVLLLNCSLLFGFVLWLVFLFSSMLPVLLGLIVCFSLDLKFCCVCRRLCLF